MLKTNHNNESNYSLLFTLSVVYIALLPFFIGKIVANDHAHIFGLYINYLHIRITLSLLLSSVIFFLYAKEKTLRTILLHLFIAGLFLLFIGIRSNILGARISTSGFPYFITSVYYAASWLLQMLSLVFALKTIWFATNSEEDTTSAHKNKKVVLLALTASLGIQAFFTLWQFFTKQPFFGEFLAWTGQPTLFTSFSQFGIYDLSRVYGTTPHPNIFAAIMVFDIFVLLSINSQALLKKILIFTAASITLLTLSKAAIVALFGLSVIYLLRQLLPREVNPTLLYAISLGAALFVLGIMPILAQHFPAMTFITTRAQIQELYRSLLTVVPSYLWFGTGLRMSIPALYENLRYLSTSAIFQARLLVEPPHHTLLLLVVELGLPASVLFLVYLNSVLKDLVKDQPTWILFSIIWLLLIFGSFDHFLLY